MSDHPVASLGVAFVVSAAVLAWVEGARELGQATINGLVSGTYFALGAVGLTLVFAVLRLVNFAHGEFLTVGAYLGLVGHAALRLPLVVAFGLAVLATAVIAVGLELLLWRPVRRRGAGVFQLLLVALGLAFFLRNGIAFIAGPEDRRLEVDVTSAVHVDSLRIGRAELIVTGVGMAAMLLVAVVLRYTFLGKQTRALADSISLAETTGIATDRIVLVTWALSGALAALAGLLFATPTAVVHPNIGFSLILSIFAAVVVGGIGNAFGALAGGLVIGLAQEWSTLVISPQLKVAVGFAVLIGVLLLRPQGIFGQARTLER